MTESQIQPGDFVHYTHLGEPGIGKVKEAGPRPVVEFWSGKVERKDASGLTPVADAAPVALLWDNPSGLALWAKEKPLKLVALAMFVDGGKGKRTSIKEKLDVKEKPGGKKKAEGEEDKAEGEEDKEKQNSCVLLGEDWQSWWSKRAKSLNALSALPEPEHFTKSAKGNEYTLLCPIEDVPEDVTAPDSPDDWKEWLLNDTNLPTFGKDPGKVCDDLSEWPRDTIERALNRLLWGAELFLRLPKPSATAALVWMDAVGRAAQRYPDRHQLTEQIGDVLHRLSQHIEGKRKESTLFWAGATSENPDREYQFELQRQEHRRQRADYENRLEQQRQEQERLERRLEQQRLEQEQERADYETKLEELRRSHADNIKDLQATVRLRNQELDRQREKIRM